MNDLINPKRNGKIILILVVVIIIGIIIAISMNMGLFNQKFSKHMVLTQISDKNREDIFEAMVDVENYPFVLPQNISEVKIINQTNNVIFAEETVSEFGVKIKLLVKHEIFQPKEHIIEILDGYAKGTKIIITFSEIDSKTTISSDVSLITSGPVNSIIFLMGQSHFESAYASIIRAFEDSL